MVGQLGGKRGAEKKKKREKRSADMPVYLGISCVKGGRGERRGGGGGRVEKEVESSTTLAGVTLEELEQTLLEKKKKKKQRRGAPSILALFIILKDGQSTQVWIDE